jgi:hypothetical protein
MTVSKSFLKPLMSAVAMLGILAPLSALGSYTVSPPVTEMVLEKPGAISTLVFEVMNYNESTIKVQVRPQMWTLDDNDRFILLEQPVGFDLKKDIMLNPREFELAPGERKPIRFGIKRPMSLPDGEYRFQIAFEEVRLLPDMTQTIKQNGVTAVINTKTILASTVYVHAGNTSPKLAFDKFQCHPTEDKQTVAGDFILKNTGARHGRLKGVMVFNRKNDAGQYVPEKQADFGATASILLPGQTRTWSEPLLTPELYKELKPGQYRLEASLLDERNVFPSVSTSCDLVIP